MNWDVNICEYIYYSGKFRILRDSIQKYADIVCDIANVKHMLIEIPDYYKFF